MSAAALPPPVERALRTLPAVLYLLFTWLASSRSADSYPQVVDDKVAHFGEYAILALLVAFALTAFDATRATPRALLAAAGLAIAWGSIDEIHQAFVATRDASLLDLAADAAGALAAVAVLHLLARRERSRR
jgi:VanZ family protein